jgi:hypothetical protein
MRDSVLAVLIINVFFELLMMQAKSLATHALV